MVKFEFTLSDIDAQNLMSIVNDEIARTSSRIMAEMADHELTPAVQANIDWYRKHQLYLKELMTKMTNKRVTYDYRD